MIVVIPLSSGHCSRARAGDFHKGGEHNAKANVYIRLGLHARLQYVK